MAITDSNTLLVCIKEVCQRFGFQEFKEGTADGGSGSSTAVLVDQTADSEIYSTYKKNQDDVGHWLYIHAGTNSGSERRIGSQSMTAGSVTCERVMGSAFDNTSQYYVMPYSRAQILDAINEVLGARAKYEDWFLVTELVDGDMRASGVTDWTDSNASSSKVTTLADRQMGPQALRVENSSANGYTASTAIPTAENTAYRIEAVGRSASGVANLIVWDDTGNVAIDSVGSDEVQPNRQAGRFRLVLQITTPDDCASLSIRLAGEESDADIAWNYVSVIEQGVYEYPLSAEIENPDWVYEMKWRTGFPRSSPPVPGGWFQVDPTLGAGSRLVVSLDEWHRDGTLWAVCKYPYPTLSADTDTTFMPIKWLVPGAVRELLRDRAHQSDEIAQQLRRASGQFRRQSRLNRLRLSRKVRPKAPFHR
tara:strand:+ start:7610 stop:8872 length:1263 start_codon:yes stop_codon:yes gene_type:complete